VNDAANNDIDSVIDDSMRRNATIASIHEMYVSIHVANWLHVPIAS